MAAPRPNFHVNEPSVLSKFSPDVKVSISLIRRIPQGERVFVLGTKGLKQPVSAVSTVGQVRQLIENDSFIQLRLQDLGIMRIVDMFVLLWDERVGERVEKKLAISEHDHRIWFNWAVDGIYPEFVYWEIRQPPEIVVELDRPLGGKLN